MTTAMTIDTAPASHLAGVNPPRPRIMSRPLALVFLASFGSLTSFYLLLSVVALHAASVGIGGIGAGLSTGVLMFATVVAELVLPRLVVRFGYRWVYATGLVLLGAPALALPAATTMSSILAVSVVRGVGFAIVVVVGGALVATLVPDERRGEGLGLYGIVAGVPAVVALPLGVWFANHVGYSPVFVAGAVAAMAGLAVVPGLPGRGPAPEQPVGVLAALRNPALTRPAIVFSVTAMAGGIVVAFLPLAVTQSSGNLAALALLVQAAAATITRWWAGRFSDRRGAARLLLPGLLASAAGMATLVLTSSPTMVLVGMVLFGAGFGVAQNASLALMLKRVPPSGYGTVSALWNLAYDTGWGVGAAGFGVLAVQTGYPVAFALTAVLMLAALSSARRERAAG